MKRIAYPRTTSSQRKMLFEIWETTKDRAKACQQARVSERTFYAWKSRFETGGYAALEQFASQRPKNPARIEAAVEQQVIELRREHPDWGKRRLSEEMSKGNNWVPVVSPNTVKRILRDAGLWPTTALAGKKRQLVTRAAEEPGQTLNVDLCFVPLAHEVDHKLPAVSGSSGRLVVERVKAANAEPDYPGQVFSDEQLSYAEAMQEFVVRSQAKTSDAVEPVQPAAAEDSPIRAQKRALRQEQTRLREARRQTRERRRSEDAAWQTLKADHRALQQTHRQTGNRAPWGSQTAAAAQWGHLRGQRESQLAQRQQEDAPWRHQRQMLRQQALDLPGSTTWVAILVVTDNCTRQGLGLPLFVAGAHVTAAMVGQALRVLLPPELQFLISDRGSHFTSAVFKQLAKEEEFLHVLIARHRPQSNGSAERFVRTLKEWLATKTWSCAPELTQLLAAFLPEYNDRPHQGLPIPGLSPNEFAQRTWLF